MGAHLINNEFKSDKYPEVRPGLVPLSVKDKSAQNLLWKYAQRRREIDSEFSDDLEAALLFAGYYPSFFDLLEKKFLKLKKFISDLIKCL